jgi:hypothetical protein
LIPSQYSVENNTSWHSIEVKAADKFACGNSDTVEENLSFQKSPGNRQLATGPTFQI